MMDKLSIESNIVLWDFYFPILSIFFISNSSSFAIKVGRGNDARWIENCFGHGTCFLVVTDKIPYVFSNATEVSTCMTFHQHTSKQNVTMNLVFSFGTFTRDKFLVDNPT